MKFSLKKIFTLIVLNLYEVLWYLFLPIALLYFFYRSIKEPGYASNLSERFSFYKKSINEPYWCHAASLGEIRAARPVFNRLLRNGEKLLITTLTLSGKNAVYGEYEKEINNGSVHIVYAPLDISFFLRVFLKHFKPKYCIIFECDLWPVMINTIVKEKVPLILAHAQYAEKGFRRDKKFPFLRAKLVEKFDLILAKSKRHKKRFEYFGAKKVLIMGDARFELEVPRAQTSLASYIKENFLKKSYVICFSSIGKGEFDIIKNIVNDFHKKFEDIFFVLVPRHPNDFNKYKSLFRDTAVNVKTRSELLENELDLKLLNKSNFKKFCKVRVFWGNSLGELNFYMAISDIVFMGDSFNDEGAHNIIEPFALRKPVIVGPSIFSIEYPALEALDAGILKRVSRKKELASELIKSYSDHKLNGANKKLSIKIKNFYNSNKGASEKFIYQMADSDFIKIRNS